VVVVVVRFLAQVVQAQLGKDLTGVPLLVGQVVVVVALVELLAPKMAESGL
jgi:hypothetical protein